jgi:hypothetical protein
MAFVANNLVDIARCLISTAAPLAGEQAVCQIEVTPVDSNPRKFLPGTFFVPVVNGGLRHDLAFMAQAMGNAGRGGAYQFPNGGTVQAKAMFGGKRFNAALEPGTKMRIDPPVPGFKPIARVVAPTTQGTDANPKDGPLLRGAAIGEPGTQLNTLELWRTYLGALPGIFVIWQGSEPADGLATSTLARARSRAGEGVQIYSETFVVCIVVDRNDGAEERANEGVRLVDMVTERLTDRQTIEDGAVIISNPTGIQIRSRGKAGALPRELAQQMQLFGITIALTRTIERLDEREYAELKRFNTTVDLEQGEAEE